MKGVKARDLDEIILQEGSGKEKLIRELSEWSRKIVNLIEKEKRGFPKA